MEIKRTPVGQFIHDSLGDTDNAYEQINELIPWIGEIVVAFNALESSLDTLLCETFSDRSDQKGLMVLHSMMYSSKVDLYKKFTDDFIRAYNWNIPSHKPLISSLKECADLRNKVVHARWNYTDSEGFTPLRYKLSPEGMNHELCRFSVNSLQLIFNRIADTIHALDAFEMECQNLITEWNNRSPDRADIRNRSE